MSQNNHLIGVWMAGYFIEQREGHEEVKHLASLLRKITDSRREASCEMKAE